MRILPLLFAVAVAACAPAAKSDANPVITAERAFAARAAEVGWVSAFKEYATADAVNLTPTPTRAQTWLAQLKDEGDKTLVWWPIYAGISKAGDLGFTTGPARIGGKPIRNYFTIWKKQPDGKWRWIFDAAAGAPAADPPEPDAGPVVLAAAVGGPGSSKAAQDEVTALEAEMAKADSLTIANVDALAPDAWALRDKKPPANGQAAQPVVGVGPRTGESVPIGLVAAESGDLVFTYGELTWADELGEVERGYYARVWQHRADGWKIVLDALVPGRSH